MARNWDLRTALMWCVSVVHITQPLCFSMDEGKQANSLESFAGRQKEEGLVSSHSGISLQEIHIQAVIKSGAESACWAPCRCCHMSCWSTHFLLLLLLQIRKRNVRHGAVLSGLLSVQGFCSLGRIPCSFLRNRSIWEWSHQVCLGWSSGFVFLKRTEQFPLSALPEVSGFQQAFDSPPASEVWIQAVDPRGSVFIQILLEVNTQRVLFYSRSGFLDSLCFLESCRREVHFPKGIHSTHSQHRRLSKRLCLVVASGLLCGGKVVTSFCNLCAGLPYRTYEGVNSYMQSVVLSSRCLPVCSTGVTFLLQTSHTNYWLPPKYIV